MEEQYDIRFNRPEPTSKQIAAHQDFEALMTAFETAKVQPTKPKVVAMRTRRNRTLVYAAAAVLVLVIAAYPVIRYQFNEAVPTEAQFFANRPFIDPPATANVPDLTAELILDPEESQTIELENGEMVISSTALARNRGKAIEQPVQIHYRQMDEVADYFLAGLPLHYVDQEGRQQLDAAVILDIYATAAGHPIDIATGEAINIELKTTINNDGSQYRLYQLDTAARSWIDAGPLNNRQVATAQSWPQDAPMVRHYRKLEQEFNRKIARAERQANAVNLPELPTPPQRKVGNNPTLELDFLQSVSLAEGSNVSPADLERLNEGGIWELLPETGEVDVRAFNVEWKNVRLQKRANDNYELTLINPERQERLIIRPILLDDGNFLEAQQRYEEELARYEVALADAQAAMQTEDLTKLRMEKAQQLAEAELAITAHLASLSSDEQQRLQRRSANFRFSIASWGIYAVAKHIQDLPQLSPISLEGDYSLDNQDNTQVYCTDGKHKTLYRGLVRNEVANLPLNGKEISARVWLISNKGELVPTERTYQNEQLQLNTRRSEPLPNSAALLRQKLVLE